MLSTKVLATGITHLTDARYFAAWQVDWMAFPLDGPGAVSPQMLMQIAEWVEGPQLMARFAHTSWKEAQAQMEPLELDGFVLSGSHYIDEIIAEESPQALIFELPANAHHLIEPLEHISLDAVSLFHDKPFTDDLIRPWEALDVPLLMHIGNQKVQPAWNFLRQSTLSGLTVEGGAEEKVGLKSFEELDELYDLMMEG